LSLKSERVAVFAQEGDQVGKSLSGRGAWIELELALGQSAAILALSSASRAFSLLSCSVSFSICKICLSRSIAVCSSL